jgi:hypothetical protein
MFAGVEVSGLEKVADYARQNPIVLVPSHRSYFDFLLLSWLFYANHLVPPHILARENMAFGPFGFVFRRAGAFFLRRSFDDPLYKEVFRRYVGYLVREGFTQEFFIEGGRSRTGKTLAPRLGMLTWNVEAFVASNRRDLFFVPVAITYERLVEESSMIEELEGGEKKPESVLGLVRARKYLQRRWTEVAIRFHQAPYTLFRGTHVEKMNPNWMILRIQPDEGIALQFAAKRPGPTVTLGNVSMDFAYKTYFASAPNTGYETLIYDCMIGDATLFQRADNIAAGWRAVQPIVDTWASNPATDFANYAAGSAGPAAADELLARDGRAWRPLE